MLEEQREASGGRAARAARNAEQGMTLLEIMVVLAIIALVAGSVGVGVFGALGRGRIKTAKLAVKEIAGAAQQFMMDNNNNCPASMEDLVANKYLQKRTYKDPWNKDFVFKCPGQGDPDGVDVLSAGPDKAEGTADDIKSWEQ